MKLIKIALLSFLLLPTFMLAEGGEDPIPGIDVIVEKDPSVVPIINIHYPKKWANRMQKMSLRQANIFIKNILIKTYKNGKLNPSEVGKFRLFINRSSFKEFKKRGILKIRFKYKAKRVTRVYVDVKTSGVAIYNKAIKKAFKK